MSIVHIREDIVYAAAEVFGRVGYDRATIDEVAQKVGIKKGSLYYHIRGKEDLLLAIHTLLIEKLISQTNARIAECDSPQTRLRAVIEVAMQLIAENRQEVTVFLNERRAIEGPRWVDVVTMRDQYQNTVEQVIAEGVEQGAFRALPIKIAALGILGMTNWGYQWFHSEGAMSSGEVAGVFSDLIINGMLPNP